MDLGNISITTSFALAAVALLGYLVGWLRRQQAGRLDRGSARRELKRAKAVVRQLEAISNDVRGNLAAHHASVLNFKEQVSRLSEQKEDQLGSQLCEEAERVLQPTLRLASQIAHAYDEIRQQTKMLMTFTEVRTDALTGLSNRRALDEAMRTMFAMMSRYNTAFTIAVFDIDQFEKVNEKQGRLYGDRILQQLARLLDDVARDTDVTTRSGGEEFIVIMSGTNLAGACTFAERIRIEAEEALKITVSGGVAMALDGDTPKTLLARAESALLEAKEEQGNCIFCHTGYHIEPLTALGPQEPPAEEADVETDDSSSEVKTS